MKPLLLLDVDGVLAPFRKTEGYAQHNLAGYNVLLNPAHGPMLLDFARLMDVDLVWATTWEDHANALIGPKIGLPELPVIHWRYDHERWKVLEVYAYAAGRPLAWLDDDFPGFPEEVAWLLTERAEIPTLLHYVDPHVGLVEQDLSLVHDWLESIRAAV